MANKILSTEEAQKMRFRYVTGVCENCGGNKFHFDPKEQTFVCEFCSTEVYEAQKEPEEIEKVEEITEEPVEETEVEETKQSYTGGYTSYYSHGENCLSALFLLVVGGALTFAPMLIEQYGLFENINLLEGGQMQIIGTEQMIEMLSTIFPIIGCMMVILAVCKVVTALLNNPYRYC